MLVLLAFLIILTFIDCFLLPKFNLKLNYQMNVPSTSSDINDVGDGMDLILSQLIDWCVLNGFMYKSKENPLNYSHAPTTFCPSLYPRDVFRKVQDIQAPINILMDKLSRDKDFLISKLMSTAESDDFTKKLLDIYMKIPQEKLDSTIQLGLLRSDYMEQKRKKNNIDIDNNESGVLQVEINTIASSFGGLSRKAGELHRYLLMRNGQESKIMERITKQVWGNHSSSSSDTRSNGSGSSGDIKDRDVTTASAMIEENPSIRLLSFGIAMAHFVYGNSDAKVVFLVQPNERNIADQRLLSEELWNVHGVKVLYMTLQQLGEHAAYKDDGKMYVTFARGEEPCEISVCYFRAGYTPDDYYTEKDWKTRELLENSAVIKCPSVGYQLAGTKRIQQVLCEPEVLERYVEDANDAAAIRSVFAEQHALHEINSSSSSSSSSSSGSGSGSSSRDVAVDAIRRAIADPSLWVLKPQREGGGNNLYGDDVRNFLKQNTNFDTTSSSGSSSSSSSSGDEEDLLGGYTLMQRIFPPPQRAAFVRNGEPLICPSVSELGVYGVFLGDGQTRPVLNEYAGYLLRTKPLGVDEGGVAAGFSVINSIILD